MSDILIHYWKQSSAPLAPLTLCKYVGNSFRWVASLYSAAIKLLFRKLIGPN
jgi:hypothetical protein